MSHSSANPACAVRRHPKLFVYVFFIVSLEYRESGDALISHAIAKSEALDYDFVERASIKALRVLANKSIHVICQ